MGRMIDADRLLEVLHYNKRHTNEFGNTHQMIAVNIDTLIRFIESEIQDQNKE